MTHTDFPGYLVLVSQSTVQNAVQSQGKLGLHLTTGKYKDNKVIKENHQLKGGV